MRRNVLARLCVALVAGALLSGCWVQVGYGPEHQRSNPTESGLTRANVARLRQAWSAQLPGRVSEPMVSENLVYVSTDTGGSAPAARVRAMSAQTGATAWERELFSGGDDSSVSATPVALSGDHLWASHWGVVPGIGSTSCSTAAVRFDAATGATVDTERNVLSSAPVTGEGVVAQTVVRVASPPCNRDPMTLRVRDADTLDELWTFALPGDPGSRLLAPTVAGGRVFVAKDSTLYAFPANGCGAATCAPAWSVNFEVPTHEGTTIVGSPVAGPDGRIFVATSPGRLGGGGVRALDAATGAALWQTPLNPNAPDGGLALADGVLYVSSAGSGTSSIVRAFPAAGCGTATCSTPVWTGQLVSSQPPTAPVVAGGVIYVGAGSELSAFDARGCGSSTCARLWGAGLPSGQLASHLSVAEGRLFAAGHGWLRAYAAS